MQIRIRRPHNHVPAPIAWAARNGAVYSAALNLLAILSFATCFWRWSWDLRLVSWFPIPTGIASHWQLWFAAGVLFLLLASQLARYSRHRMRQQTGPRRPLPHQM